MHSNQFVGFLNRYTTASPQHEAAFDEFISQAAAPTGDPLRLDTKIERYLREQFRSDRPPSVILTGNAGDGKTYLCRQIIESFTGEALIDWPDEIEWRIERNGLPLRVVKDLSEMGEETGAELLWELAVDQLEAEPQFTFLIAANEGRLRAVLGRERLTELYEEVDRQLNNGPDLASGSLIVFNLNRVSTSTYVPQALDWLSDEAHWRACDGCPAFDSCPIRFNAVRLAEPHIATRMRRLYQVLEHLDKHVTIRDMLIHLAFTATGGLDCATVIDSNEQNQLAWKEKAPTYVFYENVWGESATPSFREKAAVIKNLRNLDVGESSIFRIDDFIINGQPENRDMQAEHERLFSQPTLDLGERVFLQERRSYLHGGPSSPKPEQQHGLMQWLPHCRRKLFFESKEFIDPDRLFPFLFLIDYFRLLEADLALLDRYRRNLILGLNRSFSGLYLTDSENLYVTAQYAHAVEQPVPIVRVKIPADNIELKAVQTRSEALDRALINLNLVVWPPPRVRAEPVKWNIDLLRFEYLMRRARGGTPNVLGAECELSIRQLKDTLLSTFGADDSDHGRVDFFVADRDRYELRTLWVDDEGQLQV